MATINGTNNNETLFGTNGDDNLSGLAGNDTLFGLEGNDTLDGGTDIDSLSGGLGNDQYYLDDANDIVVELINQGEDTILSTVTYTLGANLENLTLLGNLAINGTGNDSANLIIGNSNNNTLTGGGGLDTIKGGSGNDSITGGGTSDELYGEDGNDTLTGGGGSDNLYGGTGDDLLTTAGAGDPITPTLDPFTVYDSSKYANKQAGAQALADAILAPVAEGQSASMTIINGSATYTGADKAAGFFDKLEFGQLEGVNFSLGKGIVLTSGSADIPSSNTSSGFGGSNSTAGDSDLTNIVNGLFPGSASFDAAVLEFEFTVNDPNFTQVSFDILFGSEEYPEYVGNFVDIAAVYVDDVNYAFFENGKPLSVIKDNLTPGNFYDNSNRGLAIEYDGMSAPLKILGNLGVGTTHKIRIAIADTKDSILDSGIFISNLQAVTDTGETGVRLNNSDILDGGAGNDTMKGGYGNDIYFVDSVNDVIEEDEGKGTDTVKSSINYTLANTLENLTLLGTTDLTGEGNSKNNKLIGNDGHNLLIANDGNDTLDGGAGIDTLVGGNGDDTYIVRESEDIIFEEGSSTNDIVKSYVSFVLSNNLESLYLLGTNNTSGTGNTANNLLVGNNGNNLLIGGAGDDTLSGGLGNDTLEGGAGNDTYTIDNVSDVIKELSGQGVDTVNSSVSYTLAANFENITLTGTDNINATGNDLNNIITGNKGQNILTGGKGDDTYIIDNVNDVVVELLNEGTDLIQSSVSYTLQSNIEKLTLTGADNISAIGNDLNNTLTGNTGNNTIDGGLGADLMIGGAGDDTYYVDSISDNITEIAGQGSNDFVYSLISYSLVNKEIEHVTLLGSSNLNAIGNGQANKLTGNSGDNTLNGGLGNDTLTGGAGNDTYVIDSVADVIVELANEGTQDNVQSAVSYILTNINLENLRLVGTADIDGTGNAVNNIIIGNNGNNKLSGDAGDDTLESGTGNDTLIGGSGNDSMLGGGGSDTYYVDSIKDIVKELALTGTDTVISSVDYSLGSYIENLTLTGSDNLIGNGNELNNSIIGNSGNNTLVGGRGDDTLDGGSGNDMLIGGLGNDTYVIDHINDTIVELTDQGQDTVKSSITYTLSASLEHLTLIGFNAISGTGNSGNNLMRGNGANNTLDGGLGADTLFGAEGDDTYIVDNVADSVTELTDQGNDTVISNFSYHLGNNLENIILVGNTNTNATGNKLANHLIGNSGNNILSGAEGHDTLEGGVGDDIYVVNRNTGSDTIIDNLGTNSLLLSSGLTSSELTFGKRNNDLEISINNTNDTITIKNWYSDNNSRLGIQFGNGSTLSITEIETKVSSSNSNTSSGSTGNDQLTGTAQNDTLDGGLGADTLAGGLGDDTYFIDNTGDVVTELANEGIDTVKSTISYTLSANFENLILLGNSHISATGNALDNILTGNIGNNTLAGSLGKDTLMGGYGNDSYIVDIDDVVVEDANSGIDTIVADFDYTLGSNIEHLTLTGNNNISGTGNNLNNAITGNSANNTLTGGDGKDTLTGGLGNDIYVIGLNDTADVVVELNNEGLDTVQSYISYVLANNLEHLDLLGTANINAAGNNSDNILTGNQGNNVLAGAGGNDTLIGGLGDDVYVFSRGDGIDTINNTDANNGNDSLLLNTGISADQVWLQQVGSNLEVSIVGSADKVVITDWYSNPAKRLDSLQLADGKTLLASEVDQLVNEMAKFAPPPADQTSLPSSYQSLIPIITAAW